MGRRSDRIKHGTRRSHKRKFQGNRFTKINDPIQQVENTPPSTPPTVSSSTVSSSKIQNIVTDTPKETEHSITGYRIVDKEILTKVIAELRCPGCNADGLKLLGIFSKKAGLASCLVVKCNCD